jgi:hypothetical protein
VSWLLFVGKQRLNRGKRARMNLGKRSKAVVWVSDGRFGVYGCTGCDWQNLSIWLSESVILEERGTPGKVTIPQNPLKIGSLCTEGHLT